MQIQFHALPSDVVARIRANRTDAYGNPVEVHTSDGDTYPCRHCLGEIPAGEDFLILAHRPFRTSNPYAETGPIFLCAKDCKRAEPQCDAPEILRSATYLLRGYTAEERILYGSGAVTPTDKIATYAQYLLDDPQIEFVDVRSASNNCFQCRIERA